MPFKIQIKKSHTVEDKFVSTIFCGHTLTNHYKITVQRYEENSLKKMVDFNFKDVILH